MPFSSDYLSRTREYQVVYSTLVTKVMKHPKTTAHPPFLHPLYTTNRQKQFLGAKVKRHIKKEQWNPALRTPVYYDRQFCLSRQKVHIFSLKITTPIYTDKGPEVQTLIHHQPRLWTVLFCTLTIT